MPIDPYDTPEFALEAHRRRKKEMQERGQQSDLPYNEPDIPKTGSAYRRDRVEAAMAAITEAVMYDQPLSEEAVRLTWNDTFLTTVIVPILRHQVNYWRNREAMLLERQRLTPEQVKEFQEILHNINALTHTVFLLQEWRG